MKIAQFIDTHNIGGAETMMMHLSKLLSKKNLEVTIYHFGNEYIEKTCEENNIKHRIIPYFKLYKSILTIPVFSFKFAKLLKHDQIDILHTHLYGPITGCFLGTYFYKIKHIGTLHDVYMVQERLGRGLILRIAQMARTHLVSVSKNMNQFYESYIPFSRPITNIYNGFSWKTTDNTESEIEIEKNGAFRIVIVARLIPLKGHARFINAISDILYKDNVQLLIVGDGPEKPALSSLIERLHLNNKVFLLGERNDIQQILLSSDLFALPSDSEGLSCSIIEAMAAGVPCIASNVGGNPELINDEFNGMLFSPEDMRSINNIVRKLINNPEIVERMGSESQTIAKETFSDQSMTNQYINLYNALTEK